MLYHWDLVWCGMCKGGIPVSRSLKCYHPPNSKLFILEVELWLCDFFLFVSLLFFVLLTFSSWNIIVSGKNIQHMDFLKWRFLWLIILNWPRIMALKKWSLTWWIYHESSSPFVTLRMNLHHDMFYVFYELIDFLL